MVIQQLIKTLNNTEAGRTKTNDSYLRMSKGVYIDDFFTNKDKEYYNLIRKKDGIEIQIRVENCHDGIRIYNMGKITNSNVDDLWGGDKIILEKITSDTNVKFYIDSYKDTAVFFQSFKNRYFELLTPEKFTTLSNIENLKINLIGKDRKRKDSDEINIYEIELDGKKISPILSDTELLRVGVIGNIAYVNKTKSWEYYKFNLEERK